MKKLFENYSWVIGAILGGLLLLALAFFNGRFLLTYTFSQETSIADAAIWVCWGLIAMSSIMYFSFKKRISQILKDHEPEDLWSGSEKAPEWKFLETWKTRSQFIFFASISIILMLADAANQ